MARFILPILSVLLALSPAATAEEMQRQTKPAATQTAAERLDQLFTDLKRERNERAARRIALRIGETWTHSGSDTADLLLKWANEAIKAQKYPVALDFLDQLTMLYPDYPEGWNRRATLHFIMNDYTRSMTDIARTLALEPRHFGALAGMARIFRTIGRQEDALVVYQQVLDIYPMLRSAQKAVSDISEELAGQGI